MNTLPDDQLAGKATAATTQGQSGKKVLVKAKVKAKERLTAKASGKVKINPTYKLRPKKVQVAAGKTKTLRPKKKAAGELPRRWEVSGQAKAKVTVKASPTWPETRRPRSCG